MKDRKLIAVLAILLISTLACSLTGSANPANAIQTLIPNDVQTLIPVEAQTLVASMIAPAVTEISGADSESWSGATSSACDNPLYPVVPGATWNYAITGPYTDSFTRSIASLDIDSFTDQDAFGSGTTRTGHWTCETGNLTALDPSEGMADTAYVQTEGLDSAFKTTALDGVTLPANITPGTSWNQDITLEGVQSFNGQDVLTKSQTSYNCTAVVYESVTVPAGTFDTIRVDCQVLITITINMSGLIIPTTIESSKSTWHAEGVGMVRSIDFLTNDGTTGTIELTSYNIP